MRLFGIPHVRWAQSWLSLSLSDILEAPWAQLGQLALMGQWPPAVSNLTLPEMVLVK